MSEQKLGWDIGTVKAEGNYMLEGREYCKHDHIPRKCDSCDYEEEIAKLTKALESIIEGYPNIEGLMVPWSVDSILILANEAVLSE